MFKSFVAYSEDPLPGEASKDIIDSVTRDLGGAKPSAGMVEHITRPTNVDILVDAIRRYAPVKDSG